VDQIDLVELRIPRKPEFVSVARLAVSGIAGRMEFSYDEVEDIKLAVGEACTSAMKSGSPGSEASPITIRCESDLRRISIEVLDRAHSNPHGKGDANTPPDEPISRLLMEVLMDEVDVKEDEDGIVSVRMTKYVSGDEA
jgi:serine/threonine-protein kinase RsbW